MRMTARMAAQTARAHSDSAEYNPMMGLVLVMVLVTADGSRA